ncbi:MAG: outer membrane beta-barrel protein, partial [Ferruginibacter sp.]
MSSERQYKYIEDKIKDAADAADYDFNEASWKKMEALLDKNKDKRRPFFWIFSAIVMGVLLVVGGIIYQSLNKNHQSQNIRKPIDNKNDDLQKQLALHVTETETAENTTSPDDQTTSTTIPTSANINTGKDLITADPDQDKQNTNNQKTTKRNPVTDFTPVIKIRSKNTLLKNEGTTKLDDNDLYNPVNKNIYKDKHKYAVKITAPGPEGDISNNESTTGINTGDPLADTKETKTDLKKNNTAKTAESAKTDTTAEKTSLITKTQNKKDKKDKSISGFYLVGGIGAEASSAKLLSYKNSTIVPTYGAGLGYRFNRRLSIQTGFYAGAKKYIAGPNDYKAKPGTYLSTVKIIKVDANCMIYEVPVSLQYNWLVKPTTNYYAAAGISSYIMKKEKYN